MRRCIPTIKYKRQKHNWSDHKTSWDTSITTDIFQSTNYEWWKSKLIKNGCLQLKGNSNKRMMTYIHVLQLWVVTFPSYYYYNMTVSKNDQDDFTSIRQVRHCHKRMVIEGKRYIKIVRLHKHPKGLGKVRWWKWKQSVVPEGW